MKSLKINLTILALFLVLTLFMTYPLILNMGSGIKDKGDPLLSSWIMAWNVHKITSLDIQNIFNGNIFYPNKKTIAYSEFLLTQSLISLPALLASKNPIFAQNFVILFSFLTSGLCMYFLARYLTKNTFGGIIAGIIYAFSPFMFSHLSHLQILTAGGIPLAFLFLHKFFKSEHYKHLLLFTLFFLIQALANGYYGLYIVLFAGLYILLFIILRKKFRDWRFWVKLASFLIIVLVVAGPVFYQYISIREEMGFVRKIGSYANLTSFLNASWYNRIYGDLTARFTKTEGQLFPGIFAFLLAVTGFIYSLKKKKGKIPLIQTPVHFYTIVLLLSFLFTFGPKGPYILLYKYVPGFKGIRVASRFHILVMFSLAILAAFGIKALLSFLSPKKRRLSLVIVSLFMVLILIEYLSIPLPLKSILAKKDIPEIYQWLATKEGDFAIVELPLPKPGERTSSKECPRIYYSTYHWKKLVNGYAGYFPSLYYELKRRWVNESLKQNVHDLRILGVKYIILHSSLYKEKELGNIMSHISRLEEHVKFVTQVGEDYVYELAPLLREDTREVLESGSRAIPKIGWSVTSNVNKGNVKYVIDGDISTRWHIAGRKFDVYFEFDLGGIYRIKGISMKSGVNSLHHPRSYRIELSADGEEWTLVDHKENFLPPITVYLKPRDLSLDIAFSPTEARYIRITNTEKKEENRWWSLYEIEFFE